MLQSQTDGPMHFDATEKVVFSPCVEHAISHDRRGSTFKYIFSTGESQKFPGEQRYQYMTLSDDGMTLGAKYKQHPVLIDVSSMRQTHELLKEDVKEPPLQPNSDDKAMALRGRHVYVAYNTGEIIIWGPCAKDANKMVPLDRLKWDRGETNVWACIDASSDGNVVIAATERSALAIWDRTSPSSDMPVATLEHLAEEQPLFLKLTENKRFGILGHKNTILIIDIDNERIEEVNRRDSLGTPVDVVALENHIVIGFDKGATVIVGVNPKHSEFRKQTLVLQNDDDVVTKILGVGVSSDRLTCTTAASRMGRLVYTTWDLKTKEKVMARTFLLHWFRNNEPQGIAKNVVEFILPVPEPMLYPGQLGLVKAVEGTVNYIPCVILTKTGKVGELYYNIMALPLCHPVPEGLEDYSGQRCTVSAADVKPFTETELSRNETAEQYKKRRNLQKVASSRDQRFIDQLTMLGDWYPHMCWRALRAVNFNVTEAARMLEEKKGGIPDDGLDALMPIDADADMEELSGEQPVEDAAGDNLLPDFGDDVVDDDE
eukprot:TRINITY_DN11995_c2_g2_i1.p1 TRINITY_DN11995_c2_g2~~TRINITY_DN11995_c2_g2_i1.p1  ORF type:complete len:544 (+),score=200.42 TRINITY_DN11995_c2_g2_i1:32-1663(+)